MPYQWSQNVENVDDISSTARHAQGDPAELVLSLSAHNSLSQIGFVRFIATTAALMCIPLLAFLGTPYLWIILVCLALALGLTWLALKQSWKRGSVVETLALWPDHIHLKRINPSGKIEEFESNPYWTRVETFQNEGPVPHYLTLSGAGRQVELGAFLSEDERVQLAKDLKRLLPKISQALP